MQSSFRLWHLITVIDEVMKAGSWMQMVTGVRLGGMLQMTLTVSAGTALFQLNIAVLMSPIIIILIFISSPIGRKVSS